MCVRLVVCPDSKCYGKIIHITLCVRVSVCHFYWCVCVAVCPSSKCYDIVIHNTLCVCVSFSLVCPCGGVSCFKMLWYNYSYYSVCPCVIFIGVSVWWCVLLQNAMI